MKQLLCLILRFSCGIALVSIVAILIGVFLQMMKATIDDTLSARQFDSIMHIYYLGTVIKSIAAWVLLIAVTIAIIAGILYVIKH